MLFLPQNHHHQLKLQQCVFSLWQSLQHILQETRKSKFDVSQMKIFSRNVYCFHFFFCMFTIFACMSKHSSTCFKENQQLHDVVNCYLGFIKFNNKQNNHHQYNYEDILSCRFSCLRLIFKFDIIWPNLSFIKAIQIFAGGRKPCCIKQLQRKTPLVEPDGACCGP